MEEAPPRLHVVSGAYRASLKKLSAGRRAGAKVVACVVARDLLFAFDFTSFTDFP